MTEATQEQPDDVKTVWLVFQTAKSKPYLDAKGAMIPHGEGTFKQVFDDDTWENIMPHDLPDWLKTPRNLKHLVDGEALTKHPELGGRWYRALQVDEPPVTVGMEESPIIMPAKTVVH